MFAVEARAGNSPSVTISHMNRALVDRGLGSQFATLVYGVLSSDGRFIYSNAGHNPPLMCAPDRIRQLTAGGPILGAFKDAAFEEETLYLNERDIVVLFSDGVTEARNRHDEEFGEERLISCVTACNAHPPPAIVQAILSAVREFCEEAPQADDITATVTLFHAQR